jgi:hypothetical protein
MVDPDVIAAAIAIVSDMGDSAGRFARDCDRLAQLLGTFLPGPTGPGHDVQLRLIEPDR